MRGGLLREVDGLIAYCLRIPKIQISIYLTLSLCPHLLCDVYC